jgi:hypothetical protein
MNYYEDVQYDPIGSLVSEPYLAEQIACGNIRPFLVCIDNVVVADNHTNCLVPMQDAD